MFLALDLNFEFSVLIIENPGEITCRFALTVVCGLSRSKFILRGPREQQSEDTQKPSQNVETSDQKGMRV